MHPKNYLNLKLKGEKIQSHKTRESRDVIDKVEKPKNFKWIKFEFVIFELVNVITVEILGESRVHKVE